MFERAGIVRPSAEAAPATPLDPSVVRARADQAAAVLVRGGLEPSVVRNPNLDTSLTADAWRAEVRDGLSRPFDATVRARSAHRRGVAPQSDGSPMGTRSAPPDPFERRDTLGWAGEPTHAQSRGAEHLRVIREGLGVMPSRTRERLDMLLARAEQDLARKPWFRRFDHV